MRQISHQTNQQRDLRYPYQHHPTKGTTCTVAPGVAWLTMPMGGSLNHINLYLLEDDDGWFVVDTGLNNEETRLLWEAVFENCLNGKPVIGVICTHMHPDHIGQAGMITDRFRIPLYMTRSEYYQARSMFAMGTSGARGWQSMEFYVRAGFDATAMEEAGAKWRKRFTRRHTEGTRSNNSWAQYSFPMSFQRMEHGDILSIGSHDWQVLVGSGHSPEHACLHCKSLGILISGDQILPIITSNVSVYPTEPEANPLKVWIESHDRFLELPAETFVLPAHNLPFMGVRERLRDLINHHEDRMLAIEEHCIQPRTARDLLPVLFKRRLDGGQQMMALGEAIAHCHLLMHRNRLERRLADDGKYRYKSIDPDLSRRAHPGRHDEPDDTPMLV